MYDSTFVKITISSDWLDLDKDSKVGVATLILSF